jgi:hypothetical protein
MFCSKLDRCAMLAARLAEHEAQDVLDLRRATAPLATIGLADNLVNIRPHQTGHRSSGREVPALFAKHPDWHGVVDAGPVLAEATRRRLFDRAVSDKALVTGYHFPFPAVGTIVPDGAGYTFVPSA